MKRTILSLALTSLLAACGSSGNQQPEAPVAPVAQQEQPASTEVPPTVLVPVEQASETKPEPKVEPEAPKAEAPKIDVQKESDHLDPMSGTSGVPFEVPRAEEEPVPEYLLKFLNMGVARAVVEYKMVGETLKFDLAAEMGQGVDAWVKLETERCIADTGETFRNRSETNMAQSGAMCRGQAYGYWALVNGTSGTEGTPRQCLEKGYCGFMFRQYDVTTTLPLVNPMNGLDTEF
jgi:lipoprotein